MKVSKLIKELQTLDPNMNVVLQIDEEGNEYNAVRGVDEVIRDRNGEVYDPAWTAAECCLEEDEWKEVKADKKLRVVIVYP